MAQRRLPVAIGLFVAGAVANGLMAVGAVTFGLLVGPPPPDGIAPSGTYMPGMGAQVAGDGWPVTDWGDGTAGSLRV